MHRTYIIGNAHTHTHVYVYKSTWNFYGWYTFFHTRKFRPLIVIIRLPHVRVIIVVHVNSSLSHYPLSTHLPLCAVKRTTVISSRVQRRRALLMGCLQFFYAKLCITLSEERNSMWITDPPIHRITIQVIITINLLWSIYNAFNRLYSGVTWNATNTCL